MHTEIFVEHVHKRRSCNSSSPGFRQQGISKRRASLDKSMDLRGFRRAMQAIGRGPVGELTGGYDGFPTLFTPQTFCPGAVSRSDAEGAEKQIGRDHVRTPVTNAPLEC